MSESLFNLEEVKQDSPRLQLIKKHEIQTHHAPHAEPEWIAVPMGLANQVANGDFDSVVDICASSCRLLDDAGLIFYGDSQRDVEDQALAYCETISGA